MKICIVDKRMPEAAKRALSLNGFYILEAPKSKALPAPLSSHPDMLFFFHGKTLISSAEYCEENPFIFEDLTRLIPGLSVRLTSDVLSDKYPQDAIFNALVIGNKIFLKKDSVSSAVLEYAKETELEICEVKQGYPACTTLALSDKRAITADEGMAKALSSHGIKVTLIRNGDISLPPYEYGFIGGASGVFHDKVYFIGNQTLHRDAEKIEKAIREASLAPYSLGTFPLLDLGRIIFIDSDI
ncbi:MAG: hypothetical protein IJW38_00245 [Clostridia bacterium]|nr:hypothetical protein [Clostridia bacterium]